MYPQPGLVPFKRRLTLLRIALSFERKKKVRQVVEPNLLPNLDINNDAGIAALAIPKICTAIGKVARSAEGAI